MHFSFLVPFPTELVNPRFKRQAEEGDDAGTTTTNDEDSPPLVDGLPDIDPTAGDVENGDGGDGDAAAADNENGLTVSVGT